MSLNKHKRDLFLTRVEIQKSKAEIMNSVRFEKSPLFLQVLPDRFSLKEREEMRRTLPIICIVLLVICMLIVTRHGKSVK